MKKTNIIYWTFTGLFAFFMMGSAIPDILSIPIAVEGFRQMGMPAYLLPFLGIAKALGVIAVLIPGRYRIKEWAYAGLIFDLAGAIYSVMASGKVPDALPVFIPMIFGFCSYAYYHKKYTAAKEQTTLYSRPAAVRA